MNKAILFFYLILLIINFISAQEISLDYDEEVVIGEEFNINIKLMGFEEDTYDIKIDILANGQRIAKILDNDEWKSTYYYINNIIKENQEEDFTLKITGHTGDANIEIKIRNSKDKTEVFTGYEIKIVEEIKDEKQEEQENKTKEVKEVVEQETINEETREIREEKPEDTPKSETTTLKIIKLNAQTIKTDNDTKENKEDKKDKLNNINKNTLAMYGFLAFCILLGVLFLLRKNKNKGKNEFR